MFWRFNYRYLVKIHGQEVFNTDARQFYNIKVYASSPFREAHYAHIKYLKALPAYAACGHSF